MKVYKFGGASVKDADGVRNVASIIKNCPDNLVIVVSAMGRTTNNLEELVRLYFENDERRWKQLLDIKNYHMAIVNDLFSQPDMSVFNRLDCLFMRIESYLQRKPSIDFDFEYDQIVSFGEIISSVILSAYLNTVHIPNEWIDIRFNLKTNSQWRSALIDWPLSETLIGETFNFEKLNCYVTQGFIGATTSDLTTTLGREGSDYTAAIIASVLNAEQVVVWKDVPGIMNGDPKIYPNSVKIDKMTYREAVELTFFGAQIIHPKTIRPLFKKDIPLFVKSFVAPDAKGSEIGSDRVDFASQLPIYIVKPKQILVTISQPDFSFMDEDSVSRIFATFSKLNMKVNMFQHSALNLSISIDMPNHGISSIIDPLLKEFEVRYNDGLELLTIRNYTEEILANELKGKRIYVEQRSRKIARFLLKKM